MKRAHFRHRCRCGRGERKVQGSERARVFVLREEELFGVSRCIYLQIHGNRGRASEDSLVFVVHHPPHTAANKPMKRC